MDRKRYPKGHFVGLGISFGIPLGIPVGLVLGNIGLGPAIGAVFGLIIGYIMEKKYNLDPLPVNSDQDRRKRMFVWIILVTGVILLISTLIIYLSMS